MTWIHYFSWRNQNLHQNEMDPTQYALKKCGQEKGSCLVNIVEKHLTHFINWNSCVDGAGDTQLSNYIR